MTEQENLLATRPKYTECHATEEGWVQTSNNELIVAIKNLKSRLGEVTVKRKRGRPPKNKKD